METKDKFITHEQVKTWAEDTFAPIGQGGDCGTYTSDTTTGDLEIADESGNVLVRFSNGHIRTKNFNSELSSSLGGKRFAILGDSISTFANKIPSGFVSQYPSGNVTSVNDTWWGKLIANDNMVLTINNSYAGTLISQYADSDTTCMSDTSRLDNLGSNIDYILLFGGTNDFGYNGRAVQLGEYNFNIEQDGGLNRRVFRQSVQYTIQYLQRKYPSARLMIMLPLQRGRYNEYGVNYQDYPAKNTLGIFEHEYRNVLVEAANIFGVPIIDTNKCGITYFNGTNNASSGGTNLYTIDGVHPNKEGMDLIYKVVKNELIKYL